MLNRDGILARPLKKAGHFFLGATILGLLNAPLVRGAALDFFGSPPPGDPSAFTGPAIGLSFAQDLLRTLPPANNGAFVGGPTGTFTDAGINNVVPAAQQTAVNVPTNGFPSPLFGAE